MDTFTSFNALTRALPTTLARTAKQPAVARETAYYQAKIGDVRTIEDLVKDDRLLTYAMKAWGLEDMTYAKGLVKKVLQGGVDDPASLANRLSSGRFREFASVFNFKSYGKATTAFDKVQKGTVDNYIRQQLEKDSGDSSPALQLALYFQRKAPTIKSALNILADKNLLTVVQTALNIPSATSASALDAQISLINQKMNVADLQNPAKLQKFLQRFAAMADATSSSASSNASAIILGGGGFSGLNGDILMSIQKLHLGAGPCR